MSLQLSGNGVVTGLDSVGSSDLGSVLGSKLDLAGGKILQIVRATDSTRRTTTSTSYVDVTGMSVTITPQKNTSAIIIIASFIANFDRVTTTNFNANFQLTDSSNNGISGAQGHNIGIGRTSTNIQLLVGQNLIGYDTPATINATTYKMRFKVDGASTDIALNNDNSTGQMYAIEVSA